jgi:hypothetical protein
VLTALTTATVPLTADALATALGWQLARAQAALTYAQAHPDLAGPLALRRIPPQTYVLTPRLDLLTKDQHRAVTATTHHHATLGENEAVALLHVIARRWAHCPDQDWQQLNDSDQHRNAVTALKQAGLLYSDTGPHRVLVNDDVLFSLLYSGVPQITRDLVLRKLR